MALYANFDEGTPNQLLATIGGREWDVTEMPMDAFIFFNRRQAERKREGLQTLMEDYFDALLLWLKSIDDTITAEWLSEHVSGTHLQQIIMNVFLPAMNPDSGIVAFMAKSEIKGGKSKVGKYNPMEPKNAEIKTGTS